MSTVSILIVEDERIQVEDLRLRLEAMQYRVSGWAKSGEEALRKSQETRPDLVLMDIKLGDGMSGIDAAEKIYKKLDIPVIFLTSHSDSRTLNDSQKAGAFAYLVKPLREGDLQSAVQIALYKHATEKRIRKSEETYRVLADKLAKSNEELQQFAYIASHDLQEPLRMVASYLQLLKKRYTGKLDAEAEEFIGYAVDGATRMQRLIQDMLEYSRVNTRAKPFEPTDLNQTLKNVLLHLDVLIEETQAEIRVDPLPTILADSGQMIQLFQNLIVNALKFNDQPPPRVRVFSEERQDETVFHIRDTGIGIEKEFHEQIFKLFRRLHSHDEYPGTGIGLAICKKIVERHGGRIWLESIPGDGSTFSFSVSKQEALTA